MIGLFELIAQRLRALFASEVALDFEARFLTQQAERKAELLRKAVAYDREGFSPLATELREQADQMTIHQPLVRFESELQTIAAPSPGIRRGALIGADGPAHGHATSKRKSSR